jgi:hypothetical protein
MEASLPVLPSRLTQSVVVVDYSPFRSACIVGPVLQQLADHAKIATVRQNACRDCGTQVQMRYVGTNGSTEPGIAAVCLKCTRSGRWTLRCDGLPPEPYNRS